MIVRLFVTALCCAILAVGALFSTSVSAQDKVTLRLATYVNKLDQRYQWLKSYVDTVQERTQGRVNITIFDSGTLHAFDKSLEAIQGGVSDISPFVGGAIDKRLPCAQLVQAMPMVVDWEKVVDLDQEVNAILDEEYAKAGLKILFSTNGSDQEWWFRKPIKEFGDFSGILVRSPGTVITHVIETFGGKPVYVSPKEVFTSAERGVVDAVNMGTSTFSTWNLWEVMPHMVRVNMFYNNITQAMNKAKFDALSPEDQKVMVETGWENARWATPLYNAWVAEMIGKAVLWVPNVTITSIPEEKRLKLIAKAAEGWNNQMEDVCGADMAKRLRAAFKKYKK